MLHLINFSNNFAFILPFWKMLEIISLKISLIWINLKTDNLITGLKINSLTFDDMDKKSPRANLNSYNRSLTCNTAFLCVANVTVKFDSPKNLIHLTSTLTCDTRSYFRRLSSNWEITNSRSIYISSINKDDYYTSPTTVKLQT